MPRKPLNIFELRQRADSGELTAEDLEQIRWIRTARTIRAPSSKASEVLVELMLQVYTYCERNKLTMQAFSEKCGFHKSFMAGVSFKNQVTISTLLRVAEGMNCRLEVYFVRKKAKLRAA